MCDVSTTCAALPARPRDVRSLALSPQRSTGNAPSSPLIDRRLEAADDGDGSLEAGMRLNHSPFSHLPPLSPQSLPLPLPLPPTLYTLCTKQAL